MPATRKRTRSSPPPSTVKAPPRAIPDRRLDVTPPTRRKSAAPLAWVEVVAWAAVAFVVFATRLLNLDGAPLQASEAAQAMTSWDALRRVSFGLGASPLLTDGNVLLFVLLGASDTVARVIPCAAGIFVALSPLFMRRQLGRVGALASAAVLATSPTLILASRTLDSTMPTLALGIGIVLALLAYLATSRVRFLGVIAALGALLLMSGPLAYDVLIIVVAFAAVFQWERANAGRLAVSDAVGFTPEATAILPSDPSQGPIEVSGPALRSALIVFAVTAVLAWTGFLTHFDGLGGAVSIPLGEWATSFTGFDLATVWMFPAIFLGYEALAVFAGIAGGIVAYRQARVIDTFAIWWAIVGLALLLTSNGQEPLWAALVIIPLAWLAAPGAERLASAFRQSEERRRFAAFAPLALALVATLMIAAGNASLPDPSVPRYVALAPALALVAYTIFFGMYDTPRAAVVGASTIAAFAFFGFSVHAAMLLNPGGALAPDAVFSPVATSADVRTMAADVSLILDELHLARVIEGRPVTEQVEVLEPYADPTRWYLRNAADLSVVSGVDGSPAVVIAANSDKAPSSAYAGQTFQFTQEAGPPAFNAGDLWRWLIYRQPGASATTSVKVFVKTQLAPH